VPHKLDANGPVTVTRYDGAGRQVGQPRTAGAHAVVTIEPSGFTVVTPR
jgi:hypothetical protein